MPTILQVHGWRLLFHSNEGGGPLHVHARKGDCACEFWLDAGLFDVQEEWSHQLTPRLRREIRQVLFEHFDLIVEEWNRFTEGADDV